MGEKNREEFEPQTRVLIVEDERPMRLLERKILEGMGFFVTTAGDGREAVQKLAESSFELIVTDLNMPHMNGLELMAYVHEHWDGIPILVVTGEEKKISYSTLIKHGAADFIAKPFDVDELKAKVSRIMRERGLIETLNRYSEGLEDLIRERTAELGTANKQLLEEIRIRKKVEASLKEEQKNTLHEKRRIEEANARICDLLRRSYLGEKVRFENDYLLRCWEVKQCDQHKCPAYGSRNLRCWQTVGTFCQGEKQDNLPKKIRDCEHCEVYQRCTEDPIRSIGEQFNTLMCILDAREENILEERKKAIEASRAKSEFLANMSHEIRTPMNGIMGMTHLLKGTNLDDTQSEYVDTTQVSAESLLSIINTILDFSKIEAQKLELESVPFDPRTIVADTKKILDVLAREKDLRLSLECTEALPGALLGDPGRLRQVLLNLVRNAIKFTVRGEVSIHLKSLPSEEPGAAFLHFSVRDTGIGIPEDRLEMIFEPFVQADGSTTRLYGGTGLGLSICKKFIELMGGEIGVESMVGSGSTFWFKVPFKYSDEQPAPSVQSGEEILSKGCYCNLSVLVAEDNYTNRKVAIGLLRQLGIDPELALDGGEVLQAVCDKKFDLIFMDCHMPILDGYMATKKIRDGESPNRQTPIVAMTANALKGDREECLAAGMDDYISKPISLQALEEVLCRWVRSHFQRALEKQPKEECDAGSGELPRCENAVLDHEDLVRRLGGDEELAEEVLDAFLVDVPSCLQKLTNALQEGSYTEIQSLGHKMKGAGRNAGAVVFQESAFEIEQAGKDEDLAKAASLVSQLQTQFEVLRGVVLERRKRSLA